MCQRILVSIDGSTASNRGLEEAIPLAQVTGAHLRLLQVMDRLSFPTGFEADASDNSEVVPLMKEAAEKILDQGSRHAETAGVLFDTLLIDNFALPIADRFEECVNEWRDDLVVIGTHGRRGVKRLLMGRDAEQIMRISPVPVLLVKAPVEAVEMASDEQGAAARADKTCRGTGPCAGKHAHWRPRTRVLSVQWNRLSYLNRKIA
jgi:nucleotide-binding universal stress UspA family protein